MPRTNSKQHKTKREQPPARTPEGRQNQLINLAVDLAEKKLRDGTASSQIISILLNLASTKAQLEMERMRADILLKEAKVKEIESGEEIKDLYEDCVEAMRSYRGEDDYDDEYEEEDYEG